MGVFDQVTSMQQDGINDSEIIRSLQEQGISPKEIQDALSQSQIKQAISEESQIPEISPPTPNQELMLLNQLNHKKVMLPKNHNMPPKIINHKAMLPNNMKIKPINLLAQNQ